MSTTNLKVSNADDILLLLEELCDLPYTEVQRRLNIYIQVITNAQVVFLAPILLQSEEIVIHVVGEKVLDRELRYPSLDKAFRDLNRGSPTRGYYWHTVHNSVERFIQLKQCMTSVLNNILYQAIKDKIPTVADATKLDEELLRHINSFTYPPPSSFLMIPICHPKTEYMNLVVCLIDFAIKDNMQWTSINMVQECFRFCFGFLLNALRCYEESRLKRQSQDLLAVSRKLFTHLGDFSDLLREIMAEVRKLTNAERCSLFLLDPEQQDLVAKVFDGISMKESVKEMRIPIGQGIAGHVATTGKLLNIRNAYEHPLFYRGIDKVTGFNTRNILCFPIRDENGIVGVAQLCNKMDALYFDVFDEEVATAFSIYCGISIMHSIVYKKMQDAQARNKLSNEVMMYHMKVEEDTVFALLNCTDNHDIEDFHEFHFSPRSVPCQHMPCYTIKMFDDLGLIQHWKIKMSTLARFILYVKKGYRNAPYHNWMHAFSVAHFAYLLVRNLQLINEGYMTPLQVLVFLVSCLCHDIDHRGTNNSFQTKCGTELASLYSSEGSVMERHHLAQSMCILNTEGCNVFECFNSHEYCEALDLLRSNILATDLASHFRNLRKQEEMIQNKYNKHDSKHRKLLFEMLMTCCDLSDQTKDWKLSKKTAEQIYEEFFSQGDLEKSMGDAPIEMMDRERASIPDLQIQFITNIVMPVFTNLSILFPIVQPLVSVLNNNCVLWEIAKDLFKKYIDQGIKAMDILTDQNVEEEVLKIYNQRNTHSAG